MTTKTFGAGGGGDAGGPAPAFKLTNGVEAAVSRADPSAFGIQNTDVGAAGGSWNFFPGSAVESVRYGTSATVAFRVGSEDGDAGIDVAATNHGGASFTVFSDNWNSLIETFSSATSTGLRFTVPNVDVTLNLLSYGLSVHDESGADNAQLWVETRDGSTTYFGMSATMAQARLSFVGPSCWLDMSQNDGSQLSLYSYPDRVELNLNTPDAGWAQLRTDTNGETYLNMAADNGGSTMRLGVNNGAGSLRGASGFTIETTAGTLVISKTSPDASFTFAADAGQYGEDSYFELRAKPSAGSGIQLPLPRLKWSGSTWRSAQGQPYPYSGHVQYTIEEFDEARGFTPAAFRVWSDGAELFHVADRVTGGGRAHQFGMSGPNASQVDMQAGDGYSWVQFSVSSLMVEFGVPSGGTAPRLYAMGTRLDFLSEPTNDASAVAFDFRSGVSLTDPAGRIASWRNNNTEIADLRGSGTLYLHGSLAYGGVYRTSALGPGRWDMAYDDAGGGGTGLRNVTFNVDDPGFNMKFRANDLSLEMWGNGISPNQESPLGFSLRIPDEAGPRLGFAFDVINEANDGNLTNPASRLATFTNQAMPRFNIYAGGDVELPVAATGVILKTPDGTKRYRLAIDNAGAVTTTLLA